MTAIAAIGAVQARIGAIEARLGVHRARTEATVPSSTPTVSSSTATVSSSTATVSTAPSTSTGPASTSTSSTGAPSFDAVVERVNASTANLDGLVGAGTPYADLFNAAGATYGIPPKVLAAIGWVESRYRTDAVSSAGAVGMMQFLPSTAASMGVDPTDPASAIDGAARYLRSALDRFGSIDQAIASYNVGPGAVAASGIQPGSPAETYTNAVLTATGRIS